LLTPDIQWSDVWGDKTKGTTYPEITDEGMEVKSVVETAVVVGEAMLEIPISPGGSAEVRGTGPLGIDILTSPPIVDAVIPCCLPLGVGIAALTTSRTSENPESALFADASPPDETGGLWPI
jgi:hypothetical protein